MDTHQTIILAVALALDAMLVSFSYGLVITSSRLKNSLKMAFFFGFFQFFMPIIGWFLTGYIYEYLKYLSKWVVFIIFILLALKFLKEAFCVEKQEKIDCISLLCIIGLAIATSIDALGAGISFRFLNSKFLEQSIIIGIITFILSLIGFYSGNFFSRFSSKYIESFGALLLIYLALNSLVS